MHNPHPIRPKEKKTKTMKELQHLFNLLAVDSSLRNHNLIS
jgi:hypothetical protein